ncbi:hypothetical protein ElyMa_005852700 [Elysia marginata]|uniref:Uncharacterized protein n=1 Tax=Elysia marginata TaxID=1093978 RepID=A0AAV4G0D3_9GAST|nr:hypothetical protein ElyMa_005852700 [Elysia marginata]
MQETIEALYNRDINTPFHFSTSNPPPTLLSDLPRNARDNYARKDPQTVQLLRAILVSSTFRGFSGQIVRRYCVLVVVIPGRCERERDVGH